MHAYLSVARTREFQDAVNIGAHEIGARPSASAITRKAARAFAPLAWLYTVWSFPSLMIQERPPLAFCRRQDVIVFDKILNIHFTSMLSKIICWTLFVPSAFCALRHIQRKLLPVRFKVAQGLKAAYPGSGSSCSSTFA